MIDQVKQKYGGLRFYVDPRKCSAEFDAVIMDAQRRSFTVCEECGEPATVRDDRDYIRTLCDQHAVRPEDPGALRLKG